MVTRVPRELPRFKNLSYPFSVAVWAWTVGSLAAAAAASFIVGRLDRGGRGTLSGALLSCWDALAILFVEYKAVHLENRIEPRKVLNISWALACFLLVSAYQVGIKELESGCFFSVCKCERGSFSPSFFYMYVRPREISRPTWSPTLAPNR